MSSGRPTIASEKADAPRPSSPAVSPELSVYVQLGRKVLRKTRVVRSSAHHIVYLAHASGSYTYYSVPILPAPSVP